ncbi:SpoIID/LytB domain-containing protein [Knoellia sp. p5-6-4]|uniref:SpoIID/LytB domain-containing protein n=1 Tax=unclassified Knoellia TaxID=2618719 RepID=UPI0023DC1912|nr:SpoIID/LytB domain-containing protein [Knoellia sp. p5-6-4]MDF2146461.1 SpoIID/LytB domain-containing protein [Knoellia sp. p5-6-4]
MAAAAGVVVGAPQAGAASEVYPLPYTSSWTVTGHGFGHGRGMSQYGALGAARAGKTWQEILGFYYRGTTLGSIGNPMIRVRVASLGSAVEAYPEAGLRYSWDMSTSWLLPTTQGGAAVARWRMLPNAKVAGTATRVRLEYLPTGSSTWRYFATSNAPSVGAFLNSTSGQVTTRRGSDRLTYSGQVRTTLIGSAGAEALVPVVALPLETYLRTVVPGEVFASWPQATLRAQSVAARSFAEYHRRNAPISPLFYDVYDDTRSQVFKPTFVNGSSNEAITTNDAIASTAQTAVLYGGHPAYTQFSASSGGWTSAGSKPYLVAQRDDWDAVADNPYNTWTRTVPVSTLESRFPAIGSFQRLLISQRNGLGDMGGRVVSATLTGSKGSLTVTGDQLRSTLGIGRSDWFKPTATQSWPSFPRDLSGDAKADVLGVNAANGSMRLYRGNGSGGWDVASDISAANWNVHRMVFTAGTWDGDARSDVMAVSADGSLYQYPTLSGGGLGSARKIGSGWQVIDIALPVGDFTGDGCTDLLGRRSDDATLWVYAGNCQGGFSGRARVGSGWHVFTAVFSGGDVTGDGNPDVMARTSSGQLYIYPGNGGGGWLPRRTVSSGWGSYNALFSPGDFNGDGRGDIIARGTDGRLWLYRGTGKGTFWARVQIGHGWNVFSRLPL